MTWFINTTRQRVVSRYDHSLARRASGRISYFESRFASLGFATLRSR